MISVVIPMYNSAGTIERCLISVMRQLYKDTEIIVIDDGSTDHGADVVLELASKDDRIRYIRQENGGVSRARNRGLDEAKGEWICFVDSDDAIEKDYLSSMYNCIQETGCDIVMCGFRAVTGNRSVDFLLSDAEMDSLRGNLREDLVTLRCFVSSPCMKIFRKNRIEELHLRFREDMVLAEDRYFNNHYYTTCNSVRFINRALYIYYRDDIGLSRSANSVCFENEMENLAYMVSFMENAKIKQGKSFIAEYICQCIRRYILMPGEKSTWIDSRRRLKRIRQYAKPAKLRKRKDSVIYRLLRMRCYSMIYILFRTNRRLITIQVSDAFEKK
jgi:glycosyltransferase involved in cell wall biosynthesis